MPLLILTDFYPPAYQSGGPARSCFNLSIALGSAGTPVHVLTRDRDLDSPLPFPGIETDQWTALAPGVDVAYLSPQQQGFGDMVRWIKQVPGAVLYLNSMYSVPFTIYPLLAHWLGLVKGRVVLAPRGMLKASALQFKPWKKKSFLAIFRALRWHRFIVFQASSPAEAADICRVFGTSVQVVTCAPVPELGLLEKREPHLKSPKNTRFCIIGRIHPIKNISGTLAMLASVGDYPIQLDVVGPFEDARYFAQCQSTAAALPKTVKVHFHGALPPDETRAVLQLADFFYLLTQGENFGHAIFEALALGKPVIISNQTPWRDLESQQAGWDLALPDTASIQQALAQAVRMRDKEYQVLSAGAYGLAKAYVAKSEWKEAYLSMFFIPVKPAIQP